MIDTSQKQSKVGAYSSEGTKSYVRAVEDSIPMEIDSGSH